MGSQDSWASNASLFAGTLPRVGQGVGPDGRLVTRLANGKTGGWRAEGRRAGSGRPKELDRAPALGHADCACYLVSDGAEAAGFPLLLFFDAFTLATLFWFLALVPLVLFAPLALLALLETVEVVWAAGALWLLAAWVLANSGTASAVAKTKVANMVIIFFIAVFLL